MSINSMRPTALRSAADAERQADKNNEMGRARGLPHGTPSPCPVSFANKSTRSRRVTPTFMTGKKSSGDRPHFLERFYAA